MATRKATKKTAKTASKAEKPVKEQVKEPTTKSIIEAGISRFVEEANINNQKARYKAQRAIAFQAFKELIESGEFEDVIDRALEGAAELPSGWTLDARPAKKTTKKAAKAEKAEEPEEVEDDNELEEDEVVEDEPETAEEDELEEDEPEVEEKKPAKKVRRRRRPARK